MVLLIAEIEAKEREARHYRSKNRLQQEAIIIPMSPISIESRSLLTFSARHP